MLGKRFFPFVVALLALVFSACSNDSDDDTSASFDQLPEQAQSFVKLFFSSYTLQSIETSSDGWEVNFTNGTEIDFNSAGSWTSIDCGPRDTVPYDLVPVNIHTFVKENYPSAGVVEISRDNKEYEVELSNGIEATFDLHGFFLHYN